MQPMMRRATDLPQRKHVAKASLTDATSFSVTYIYRLIKDGKFPAPIEPKFGRLNRWPERRVQAWIDRREAGVPLDAEPDILSALESRTA